VNQSSALFTQLERWVAVGALRQLDLALAQLIHEQCPDSAAPVLLAAALVSERNSHGHVCLDLTAAQQHPETLLLARRPTAQPVEVAAELKALLVDVTLSQWLEQLRRSPAVADQFAATAAATTPLVLAGTAAHPLLYLRRYWRDEQLILDGITARLRQPLAVDDDVLRQLLAQLFDAPAPAQLPWDRIACALAVRSAFAIITGGPGTGKTTTVVRLLALLQGLALAAGQPLLRIRLAAPTGKAAARLNESIAGRVAELPLANLAHGEQIRAAIPTAVTTVHRLLGPRQHSRHFHHHAGQPLPVDVVVIDEASMVDVELLARLLEALRPEARLLVLGDKDQLASVEAGAVLGDLCRRAAAAHYTAATCDWLQRVTGVVMPEEYRDPNGRALDQAVAMLRHSYRFDRHGGIGALATLVNAPPSGQQRRAEAVLALFAEQDDSRQLTAIQLPTASPAAPAFDELVSAGYAEYLKRLRNAAPAPTASAAEIDQWALSVLAALGKFQLLTALRDGIWGVSGLNQHIIALLRDKKLLDGEPTETQQWFAGRPVLVTRNDPNLGLMNGDIGITLEVPLRQTQSPQRGLRVAFPADDGSGGVRWMLPSRLQAVETVFAMTVHKAQGSEFEHTALLVPDVPNPVLTQELLYTGITRSKKAFTLIYYQASVLEAALQRRVTRVSGIAAALHTEN